MVFKKLFGAGVSVDTVLPNPNVRPGELLSGEVRFSSGSSDFEAKGITVALVARVEVESGDSEFTTVLPFQKIQASGGFHLAEGAHHVVPFQLPVPWEAPISAVGGQHLRGMTLGVHTELELARALDKTDLDPITIHPLPAQERLLEAFSRLGFRFKGADLEQGRLVGSHLPFYQEIEFWPAPQYAGSVNELEVTFIGGPQSMDVLLELDKRGGFLTSGHDAFNRFTVPYAGAESFDWENWLHERLSGLTRHYGFH